MDGEEEDSMTVVTSTAEQESSQSNNEAARQARRTRVSLACQRCKQRKQKCNGSQPACTRCVRLKLECHYIMPTHPKPGQARLYIRALEDRVAELETVLNDQGKPGVAQDHWVDSPELESGYQPLFTAVRDLSLDVAGSYVGGASTITLGRVLETALGDRLQLRKDRDNETTSRMSDTTSVSGANTVHSIDIDPVAADKMIESYLKHLSTNYPILFSFQIRQLHERRNCLESVYEECILHLIYGLGGHFLEKIGDSSHNYHSDRHYMIALNQRESILRLRDTRSLTYLLLLCQHCVRMPKDPGPWTFIGLAMKMCVDLGLHRRRRSPHPSLRTELEKRLFWSCYYWDRETSIALGRPPSISDHDIDVQLPLDVPEANQSLAVLRRAAENLTLVPAQPPTTLTCFIHLVRLKRIESEIQHEIYRVDSPHSPGASQIATEKFLERLRSWKDQIPPITAEWDNEAHSGKNNKSVNGENEYHSLDSYMVSYHKCMRVLLQPQLYEKVINPHYLDLSVKACEGVCETYKRLHHRMPLAFSSVSLQTVFLAGLTLIYCMWHDPNVVRSPTGMNALTDCSIMLYVMTERWPTARKYRDMFESIKQCVMTMAMSEPHQPRPAVVPMNEDLRGSLFSADTGMMTSENRDDLEQMLADMTGQSLYQWHDLSTGVPDMDIEQFQNDMDIGSYLSNGTPWETVEP